MLTPVDLLDALLQSCRPVLPNGTTLLKSGDSTDSSLSSVWLEFWIDRMVSSRARRHAPRHVELSITVNCFGRPPATPGQVQAFAESARHHLTRLNLTVSQDSIALGLISLQEAEMRDLSRPSTQKSAGLRQWTVTVRGTLQMLQLIPS